jgi:hypothetical protein
MRSVRDFAVGGVRPYHSPNRPRVADPDRRRRIANYLSGGTAVGRDLRTDGVWVWPIVFIDDIRLRGLAPEPDFLRDMQRQDFRAETPPYDAHLEREAKAAARAGSPKFTGPDTSYFVRVDDGYPPDAPLSLLRRLRWLGAVKGSVQVDEALWRDLTWHPTHTFATHSGEYDLREVTEAHAAGVMDRWCEKWHRDWKPPSGRPARPATP